MAWFFSNSNNPDIVLTSRIRLARNISGIPFVQRMNKEESERVIKEVSSAIIESNSAISHEYKLLRLRDMDSLNRVSMVEKHLISMNLLKNYDNAAVILNKEENVSIMINEEDHIRLQVIYPGLKLKEAYEYASRLDDLIEERVNFAFDSKLGYLTSCPTNLGTGIRASVMMHLPGLTLTKSINDLISTVNQVGMTIRGIYGEGSNIMGNIYQISNQVSLGLSEEEIINNLVAVIKKIIDQEKRAREVIMQTQPKELEDDIYRSLGILKYARLISASECLNLLSRVRMGVEMGIIKDVDIKKLNELLVNVQPASLQLIEGREIEARERDFIRAKILRESLK